MRYAKWEYKIRYQQIWYQLQYLGHQMQRAYSPEKTLTLGKIEGRQEEKGVTRMR